MKTYVWFYLMLRLFLLQDWLDIDFGIAESVEFIAISFVKSAEVIKHLKSYIAARSCNRYDSVHIYVMSSVLLLVWM